MANAGAADAAPLVLLVDVDCATAGLLGEWLNGDGCCVTGACGPAQGPKPALAIVDVPYPRNGGAERVQRVQREHPDVPVLALSPSFFGTVICTGMVARTLGAAGVLPKPVRRDALLAAVNLLLQRAGRTA